ncbi:30S ribosomal protein S6 [Candidatus Kuenenbacteria bacterium RIFCSPHIGHO2_02_FULL_39_13]|uniref:Small ribosomal subunit protein bS6 n=1 Tax=Candidatus Kuenenbacteria bacterium RIFCSPHIGHO2_02_FULL_39_13 TaxID=1798561 RepID=A0A1F6FLE2_9BACT|nr:MAG: 30S ribosomal protein S6 [Candidatus Kuenenbacteria bacterium RIFCSPHIGHO2_02_FULL_39_13]
MSQETAKDLKEYEILYFLSINLSPDEIQTVKGKINELIAKAGGVIVREDDLGKRKLAYMIKRARHGHYLLSVFKAPAAEANSINHELELMPEILRHKLVRKEDIKTVSIKEAGEYKKTSAKQADQEGLKSKSDKKTKVDTKELDKKIDELLSEDNI